MIKKIIPFFIILSCIGCNSSNPIAVPVNVHESLLTTNQQEPENLTQEVYETNNLQSIELPKELPKLFPKDDVNIIEKQETDCEEIPNDNCTIVIKIVL